MKEKIFYEFGPFVLDSGQRVLLCGGERVSLHPKTFLLLQVLVEAEGRILSKDDLLAAVWSDVVIEENSLTKNISLLRKALGKGSESAEFIETIPKIGYRFRAESLAVRKQNGLAIDALAVAGQPAGGQPEKSGEAQNADPVAVVSIAQPPRVRWLWVGLAVALAMGTMLAWSRGLGSQRASTPVPAPASVAVLPFKNLTGDVSQDFFTDGLAEDLTNDLSRIRALNVIARNSAFTFKGQEIDAREAGRKLNVAAILAGTVQRVGDGWEITTTLQETATGRVLWRSEHHNRPLEDIFAIQNEIRCNVAANLQAVFCGETADGKRTNNWPI